MKDKIIKKGKVAVLVSKGYGAGWWTWNRDKTTPFEPKVVKMVLSGRENEITEKWCQENLGVEPYCGGVDGLVVEWVPIGTRFSINEYDGNESLYLDYELDFVA